MIRNDLTSLTLAELSFVLLFLMIVVVYTGDRIGGTPPPVEAADAPADTAALQSRIENLKHQKEWHEKTRAGLEAQLAGARRTLNEMVAERETGRDLHEASRQGRIDALERHLRQAGALLKARDEEIGILKARLAAMEDEKKKNRGELQSKQTPSCREVGLNDGFIATVAILGSDRFRIDGVEFSFAELRRRFNRELNQAAVHGCIQLVKVYTVDGVSIRQFDSGLKKLEQLFYLKRLGVR